MEQVHPGRLRRRILVYSIVVTVLLCGVVAAVGIMPLQQRLQAATRANLAHTLDLRTIAVEEYLSRARDVALQVTSRTRIRQQLAAYNRGDIPLTELVAFTGPKLGDAMRLSPEVLGITRLDAEGREVVSVGTPVPQAVWQVPPPEAEVPRVGDPVTVAGRRALVVGAAIRDRQGAREGTDIVLFDIGRLRDIVTNRHNLGTSGEVILTTRVDGHPAPVFPLRHDAAGPSAACGLARGDSPLAAALRDLTAGAVRIDTFDCPMGTTDVVAMGRVPDSDWRLLVRMDRAELFADIHRVIFAVAVAIAGLTALGTLGLVLVLHPLTGRILVRTRDLADQVRDLETAHRELQDKSAVLARSNQELERFAKLASHDLKEPLRTVVTYSQLLEKRYGDHLDAEGAEIVGIAVGAATRMRELINDLLAYTQLGTTPPAPQRSSAEEALTIAKANLQAEITESGARLEAFDLPEVMADRRQLVQLFSHLLGNAVKFHRPDAAPHVQIYGDREDGMIRFSVEDDGIGIEPEYRDRVFAIFERLHAIDTYPGTGVGLAICQRIVEAHGGTIRVEERPGGGSIFRFTLPAADTGLAKPGPGADL